MQPTEKTLTQTDTRADDGTLFAVFGQLETSDGKIARANRLL